MQELFKDLKDYVLRMIGIRFRCHEPSTFSYVVLDEIKFLEEEKGGTFSNCKANTERLL